MHPSRDVTLSGGAAGAPVVGATSTDKSGALTVTDVSHRILDTLAFSPDVEIFCLRHMAQIAKKRNAYQLMERVLRTCRERGIALDAVLTPLPSDSDQGDDDPGASPHPFEILAVVNSCAGYCFARTICPSGDNVFFSNPAFEMYVLSIDACNRAYERNEAEVISLFLHADDLTAVQVCMATTWKRAASYSGQLTSGECLAVRVWLRRRHAYVPCTMRVWVLIQRDSGRVSAAMELLPNDEPPPLSLPPLPSSPSSLLRQLGSESAMAGATDCELFDTLSALTSSSTAFAELLDDSSSVTSSVVDDRAS